MRLELNHTELSICKSALENSAIKGKDVHVISDLLKKLDKGIDKEVAKNPMLAGPQEIPPQKDMG